MAHQISIRENGFAEIAFVGDTPWHGLGQTIHHQASIEEWQKEAGMDWTIESSPVQYYTPKYPANKQFKGKNVLFRSDTNEPLSIVSNYYHPVQPKQVLEFFKELVSTAGFEIQVAGTLKGGKRMWAIANTGKFAEVSKDDGIGGFLLLSTSCDKSLSTTARFTSIRVVCNNTLSLATEEKNDTVVSYTHMQKFDPKKMQDKLLSGVNTFGAFVAKAKWLQEQQMNAKAAEEFLSTLLKPYSQVKDADIKDNRQYQAILALFDGGAKGYEMVGHTKWGMLNAVTEFYDHHQPNRSSDARLDSAFFGRGDHAKTTALQLLTT